ncbi:hypothetical protein BDR05DRAFT_957930 [Suillus weaverae]|nr:hypothetical protein BDR05DRAFT_957930 [Suillus weaverae]
MAINMSLYNQKSGFQHVTGFCRHHELLFDPSARGDTGLQIKIYSDDSIEGFFFVPDFAPQYLPNQGTDARTRGRSMLLLEQPTR